MGYPQPYGQGREPVAYVAAPMNTLAVVSVASGIASYFILPVIGGLVAIVAGHMARGQIRRTGERGGTLALVGLILGYLHFVVLLLVLIVVILIFVVAGAAFFTSQSGH
jgi:hypothetical protein